MYAIVKDGAITQTATTVQKLFPNTSFPSGPNTDFLTENNVKDVVNGEQKNRTYYFVSPGNIELVDGVPTQKYTNTAKDLAGLKTDMTSRVKSNAGTLLAKTDWMVIRKYERDVAIPSATATYRAAVITECTRLESAIAGAGDVDALATVMSAQNWPEEP
jgi:pyruvate/oxaloacetate carboxyltransferase